MELTPIRLVLRLKRQPKVAPIDKPKFTERRANRPNHSRADRGRVTQPVPVGPEPPGLDARRLAVRLIEAVLLKGHTLEDALAREEKDHHAPELESRDRAFAHLIAATVLRRHGSLTAVIAKFLERPLPKEVHRPRSILLVAAAQILLLDTPRHAAINLAVEHCRRDPDAARFDKLSNAVLRRVATDGPAILTGLDWPKIDVPDWAWQRWVTAYGPEQTGRLAAASLREAALDIAVKADAAQWAARLNGQLLPTGSIRLSSHGRVESLEGYAEGAWWVQDAAAALPARCLGDVRGLRVLDLCAAPGGKTAALAAAGALVTAIDIVPERLARLRENMDRLKLSDRVETIAADCLRWTPASLFDAVLLDAPCSSTGTIRRHPDLLHLKRLDDIAKLARLQADMLVKASAMVRPGGLIVYCTCSLEPDEGADVVDAFLASNPGFARRPIVAAEIGADAGWITPSGDLRTFPFHMALEPSAVSGMDGFFAALLLRTA